MNAIKGMNPLAGITGHNLAETGAQRLALRKAVIDPKDVVLCPVELVDGRLTWRFKLEFGQTACWRNLDIPAVYTRLFARRFVGFLYADGNIRERETMARRGIGGGFNGVVIASHVVLRK